MKKIITLLIISIILTAFAGCSQSSDSKPKSSKATKSATEETTEAATQANTQKITTTDEFPTVADDES